MTRRALALAVFVLSLVTWVQSDQGASAGATSSPTGAMKAFYTSKVNDERMHV